MQIIFRIQIHKYKISWNFFLGYNHPKLKEVMGKRENWVNILLFYSYYFSIHLCTNVITVHYNYSTNLQATILKINMYTQKYLGKKKPECFVSQAPPHRLIFCHFEKEEQLSFK